MCRQVIEWDIQQAGGGKGIEFGIFLTLVICHDEASLSFYSFPGKSQQLC